MVKLINDLSLRESITGGFRISLSNFFGRTFVAFIDIAGFKAMMKEGKRAQRALDIFYSFGYEILKNQDLTKNPKVEGLFVSDCGILFVNWKYRNININNIDCLTHLLNIIKDLNKKMRNKKNNVNIINILW